MEEKVSSWKSVVFLIFIGVCFLLLHFVHFDSINISEDRPKKLRFIYNDSTQVQWGADIQLLESTSEDDTAKRDTTLVVLTEGLEETDEVTPIVDQDSLLFRQVLADAISKTKKKKNLPIIRYYKRPKDSNKVYSLKKYGYYIHEREPDNLDAFYSNVISYGDSVSNEDILIIAYTLMSEGLTINDISPSKYHADWKYHAVEIGTDTTLLSSPAITPKDLLQDWGYTKE